jgi:predicted RNA-binding Zn-ribbon protein involved in translation (DUF1610 family)
MMDQRTATDGARINELYWQSAFTIDQILDQVGSTRSQLYTAILPVSADSPCPTCAEILVFTNRTSRSSRRASCPGCGLEAQLADGGARPSANRRRRRANGDGDRGHGQWKDELRAVSSDRAALIGGAAALGIVVGAAATRMARE